MFLRLVSSRLSNSKLFLVTSTSTKSYNKVRGKKISLLWLADPHLEEDHQERSDEVVDALDVAGGRVTDGPDVEDPLNHLLDTFLLEQTNQGRHPRDIYCYLSVNRGHHCLSYSELWDVRWQTWMYLCVCPPLYCWSTGWHNRHILLSSSWPPRQTCLVEDIRTEFSTLGTWRKPELQTRRVSPGPAGWQGDSWWEVCQMRNFVYGNISRDVYNHFPPIIWRITSLDFAKRPHKKRKVWDSKIVRT